MTPTKTERPHPERTFRGTLVRVLAVQVVSLLLLWALQARWGG